MLAISKRYLLSPLLRMVLEEGLVRPGRAGRHHHPVEIFRLDDRTDLLLGILGTGKEVLAGIDHVGQAGGIR